MGEKMPTGKKVLLEIDPQAELMVGEVSDITGYSVKTLRRLDGNKIPASHRNGQDNRVWFAADVKKIIEFRKKSIESRRKQVSNLYKLRGKGDANGSAKRD